MRQINGFNPVAVPRKLRQPFVLSLLLASVCAVPANAAITIANEGTPNPTLLYKGEPMFKVGPLPETAVFAFEWGSRAFRHRVWLDWMAENHLHYGRVYPENGYVRVPERPYQSGLPMRADGRIYPFEVVRWQEDRPMVDLTRFNPEYWDNMARVIRASAERGIVLHMQLYQRVYFEDQGGMNGWSSNYFNPANNVNGFPVAGAGDGGVWEMLTGLVDQLTGAEEVRDGYGLWGAMTTDPVWVDVHRRWVEHTLDAIGDNGNVIIDLMNEGAFNKGMTEDWIESTLDIIARWERETGNRLLVGMDFDHLYKAYDNNGNIEPLEYVLSHPRLDVIICEGSESHVAPMLVAGDREALHKDLAVEFRRQYRKPVISANSPSYGPQMDLEALHLYHWYALMSKVQGVGVYAKDYTIDFSQPRLQEYARRARLVQEFFGALEDYAALQPAANTIREATVEHRLALSSSQEVVVYLHAGEAKGQVEADTRLALDPLELRDGAVSIVGFDPRTGESSQWRGRVRDGALAVDLPAFKKDLALHIVPLRQAGDGSGSRR